VHLKILHNTEFFFTFNTAIFNIITICDLMIIRSTLLKEKKKRKYYVKPRQEEDEKMKVKKKNEMNVLWS